MTGGCASSVASPFGLAPLIPQPSRTMRAVRCTFSAMPPVISGRENVVERLALQEAARLLARLPPSEGRPEMGPQVGEPAGAAEEVRLERVEARAQVGDRLRGQPLGARR